MSILGINCYANGSSVSLVENGKILFAQAESKRKMYCQFPHNALRAALAQRSDISRIVFPKRYRLARFEADVKKYLPKTPIQTVDYLDALGMSAVVTTNWSSCAVLVVDTRYVALGYFNNGEFTWIKRFDYPNNLCLFYSSATRFLGYSPLEEDNKLIDITSSYDYYKVIREKVIHYDAQGYNLLVNLEKGIGTSIPNSHIAASVQKIFTEIVIALAQYLQNAYDTPRLAYAGWGSFNHITNAEIIKIFPEIAMQPAYGALGVSLGAAALVDRPLYENAYLGSETANIQTFTDIFAAELLNGKIMPISIGKEAFAYSSLGTRGEISAMYANNLEKMQDYYLVSLDKDFEDLFGIPPNKHGLIGVSSPKLKLDNIRAFSVNSASNPYLNRVLELTRLSGHYALAIQDSTV